MLTDPPKKALAYRVTVMTSAYDVQAGDAIGESFLEGIALVPYTFPMGLPGRAEGC